MKTIRDKVILTWNKKCSCYQFNLPPRQSCPGVAERLKDPRSICNFCYAYYGRSGCMKAAKEIMQHNLAAVRNTSISGLVDKFLSAAAQVPEKHQRYFRWFGCGDAVNGKLQAAILGLSRIDRWFRQAWCPTQVNEWPLVRKYAYSSTLLRHTAPNVGDVPPPGGHSVLLPNQVMPGSYRCPGKCGLCRVCWLPWHRWISIVFPFHGSAILQAKLKKARKEHDF